MGHENITLRTCSPRQRSAATRRFAATVRSRPLTPSHSLAGIRFFIAFCLSINRVHAATDAQRASERNYVRRDVEALPDAADLK